MSSRRRRSPTTILPPDPVAALPAPECPAGTSRPRRSLSRRRLWAFRILAIVVLPTMLLGFLEIGLRVAGIGYDPRYFVEMEPAGEQICGNPQFGWRYFPQSVARMPLSFSFPRTKQPGTYRIFVLGSSAAQGFPDPSFSFGRMLDVMLHEAFPAIRFEVINTAMIAVNSHVIRAIAAECASYEPDALIIYEGNNEVVGPFGPGTVFAPFSDRLWAIRLQLASKHLRLIQFGSALATSASTAQPAEWKGMEFFLERPVRLDDSALNAVYEHFRKNLEDIIDVGRSAGADVLLCTVGVNLRNCAPFGSAHASDLSPEKLAVWQARSDDATQHERAMRWSDALAALSEAARIDPSHAATLFRIARCYEQLHQLDSAKKYYAMARDADTLRFRTDSRENELIRKLAERRVGDVSLVDIEQRMSESSDAGIPGRDLFYEHCHMTFRGNYVIARALFESIAPRVQRQHGLQQPTPAPCDLEQCRALLAFTSENERASFETISELMSRPPFTPAIDSTEQRTWAAERLAAAEAQSRRSGYPALVKTYESALQRRPRDPHLLQNFAALLEQGGELSRAATHLRAAIQVHPFDATLISKLGAVLVNSGNSDEGKTCFERALAAPTCDAACKANEHFNLGLLAHQAGRTNEARAHYEKTLKYRPGRYDAHTNLGQIHLNAGEADAAIRHFRAALNLDPADPTRCLNLASALAYFKRMDEAIAVLRTALTTVPDALPLHLALIDLLMLANRQGEAVSQAEASLKQIPQSPDLYLKTASVLIKMNRSAEAQTYLEAARSMRPEDPRAAEMLKQLGPEETRPKN